MDACEKPEIPPVRLGPDSNLKFACHKGVKCFTQCCRDINITLTPYDIIRLKKRLQLSSEEFLAVYTEVHLLEKTDLPVVTLRLLDDEKGSGQKLCPFVREDGCVLYEDRPTTCRYYPLGTASLSHKEGADDQEFYFFVNEPHCLGFEEDKEWTIREWRADQGVDIYDDINARWTDLIVRKRSFPPNMKFTDQAKQMFFMASYNLDQFKKFIFDSSFLKRYEIDPDTVEKIRDDETELLNFGIQWLKDALFKEGNFNMRSSLEADEAE